MRAHAICISMFLLASGAAGAEEEWNTGGRTVKWSDGQPCGTHQVCFTIEQPGVGRVDPLGIVGTKNCWRQQIWTTNIVEAPEGVSSYELLQDDGRWQAGIKDVHFAPGSVVVRTYVVQDHGGPQNPCLSPGYGRFTLRFPTGGGL